MWKFVQKGTKQWHIQEAIKVLHALVKQNPTYKPATKLLAELLP